MCCVFGSGGNVSGGDSNGGGVDVGVDVGGDGDWYKLTWTRFVVSVVDFISQYWAN